METAEPRPSKRPAFPPVAAEALGVGLEGRYRRPVVGLASPRLITLSPFSPLLGWKRRTAEGSRAGQQVHSAEGELDEDIHADRGALATSNQV